MTLISEIASQIWKALASLFKYLAKIIPRIIAVIMWILAAVIILPCVFIAGEIYPKWQKWGENL